MWSRTFHRRCALCCKSLSDTTGRHIMSQGRSSRVLHRYLPAFSDSKKSYHVSSVGLSKFILVEEKESDSSPEPEAETRRINRDLLASITGDTDYKLARAKADRSARGKKNTGAHDEKVEGASDNLKEDTDASDIDLGPNSRTLWLGIPNSDMIREALFVLSRNIIDVELHRRVAGHSYAFLVFGSGETARKNYRKLKRALMDVEYLDDVKRTLWIHLGKSKVTEEVLQKKLPDCEDIKLTKLFDGTWHAYVKFATVEAMYKSSKLFPESVIETRTEQVFTNSLWLVPPPSQGRTTEDHGDQDSKCKEHLVETYANAEEEDEPSEANNTRSSKQQPRDRSAFLFLDVGSKQMSQEDFQHLCPDFDDALVINKATQRYAYLKFPSSEYAKKNRETIEAQGHSIFHLEELSQFNYEESIAEKQDKKQEPLARQEHKKQAVMASVQRDTKKEQIRNSSLYVKNLKSSSSLGDISKMSESIKGCYRDKKNKKAARFSSAFVRVTSPAELENTKALLEKNGYDVNYAQDGGTEDANRTIYVKDERVSAEELKSSSPEIVSVQIVTKTPRRYAKVTFKDEQTARNHTHLFRGFKSVVFKGEEYCLDHTQ